MYNQVHEDPSFSYSKEANLRQVDYYHLYSKVIFVYLPPIRYSVEIYNSSMMPLGLKIVYLKTTEESSFPIN